MRNFENMTARELWALREEVVLGSIYVSDYRNSFGWDAEDISDFMEGYIDYLEELADERGGQWFAYDCEENLWGWFNCYDDLTWVKETEEDEDDLPWWEY